MQRTQGFHDRSVEILLRSLPAIALAFSLAIVMSGCGVKMFGGKLVKTAPPAVKDKAYGPFYSSGQGTGSMSASTCLSLVGRPCTRARASVGMPFQFDSNPNASGGQITAGTTFPVAPYAGTAGSAAGEGAGRTAASAGKPRVENRDLHVIQRQVMGGSDTF